MAKACEMTALADEPRVHAKAREPIVTRRQDCVTKRSNFKCWPAKKVAQAVYAEEAQSPTASPKALNHSAIRHQDRQKIGPMTRDRHRAVFIARLGQPSKAAPNNITSL